MPTSDTSSRLVVTFDELTIVRDALSCLCHQLDREVDEAARREVSQSCYIIVDEDIVERAARLARLRDHTDALMARRTRTNQLALAVRSRITEMVG